MKRLTPCRGIFILLPITFIFVLLTAQEWQLKRESLFFSSPPSDKPTRTLLNINNLSYWQYYDGRSGISPDGSVGVIYPRGTAGVVFQDGIIWGGITADTTQPQLRVGGQTYAIGTQAGRILPGGSAEDPNLPHVRIYRIRQDYLNIPPEELLMEAAELFHEGNTWAVTEEEMQQVKEQYERDWQEWPVEAGAPFYDLNNNGIYEPDLGEEPGLQGADQVIWYVCNDLNAGRTANLYGSPPLGLEMQVTMWGYQSPGPFSECTFRRIRLINKSGYQIDSVYIAHWSDCDIGDYTNDVVGCDSLLNLGFAYNGFANDEEFDKFGLPPAAAGYAILQGPVIPGRVGEDRNHNSVEDIFDYALFNFKRIGPGFINLPMTSFGYFASGNSQWYDPQLRSYNGTLQWYNLLRGYLPLTDIMNPIPFTHKQDSYGNGPPTFFPLNGDPPQPWSPTNDVDGQGFNLAPGARRFALNSGPFKMMPGDSQEVIFAFVGGIKPDGNNLTAVADMKNSLRGIKALFGEKIILPEEFHRINHPTATTTRLQVQVNLREYSDVNWTRLQLEPEYGNEPGFSIPLFDDGAHGDELAGDNIWGGSIDIENRKYPFRSNLFIYGSQKGITLNKFHSGLTLRPKPELINWRVSYENGRQDGKVSHSEKVHLAFDIRNPGGLNGMDDVTLRNLNFKQSPTTITNIPAGAVVSGASLFLKLIAPATGDSFDIPFSVEFDHNTFSGRLSRPITPWDARYNWGDTLEVTALSGNPENLLPIVADPALLTGHQYMVTFREDTLRHTLFWRLTDLTTTHIRLDDLPVGTDPEAEFPIVNGIEWKVFNPESLYVIHKHSGSAGVVEIASAGAQFAPARLDDAARPFRGNSLWPGETSSSEYDIRTGTGAPPQAGTVIPFITTQSIQPTDTFLVQAPDPPVGPQVPFSFQLGQNYPNPFNHETLIPLYISKDTHLRLDIFNILGQKVRTLVNEKLVWGDHLLRWDGRNNAGNTVASGLYIYRIKVEGRVQSKKMLFIR